MANRRTGTDLTPSGRNSLLTPALQAQICDSVRAGNWLETAAHAVAVTPESISHWKLRGHQDLSDGRGNSIYARFVQALTRAEADAEAASVARIRKAGQKDWRAEAWYLERRYPERWVARQNFTLESAIVDGPINAEFILSGKAADVVDAVFDAFEAQVKPKLLRDQDDSRP